MKITIERIYDFPSSKDSYRVLVDRLWPRGISKEEAKLDSWWQDLAPSTDLRKWFNHDPKKWREFRQKYLTELASKHDIAQAYLSKAEDSIVLLYAAKDTQHTHAIILKEYLETLLADEDIIRCSSPPCYFE